MITGGAAYYDLVQDDRTKKFGIISVATVEQIAREMSERDVSLVEGKTFVIQEGDAPGGHLQGVFDGKPKLVRGSHELERIAQL